MKPAMDQPAGYLSAFRKEKFRQIRKMTAAINHPTLRLVRVRIGSLRLDGMGVGQVVPMEDSEIGNLK